MTVRKLMETTSQEKMIHESKEGKKNMVIRSIMGTLRRQKRWRSLLAIQQNLVKTFNEGRGEEKKKNI
jgi:hypothetical protein